jgi:hypothetical protein
VASCFRTQLTTRDSLIFSNNVKLYKPSGNYSQNDRAVFFVKFDSTGNALWANFIYGGLVSFQYELENWGSEFGQVFKPGITLDNSGNLIFSVIKSSEISKTLVYFTDTIISVEDAGLLLIKYSPLGELVWINQIKSSVNSGSTKVSSITYSEVVFDNKANASKSDKEESTKEVTADRRNELLKMVEDHLENQNNNDNLNYFHIKYHHTCFLRRTLCILN